MTSKIVDIHVGIRGFLDIHVWICYGFSDQGPFDARPNGATAETLILAGLSGVTIYTLPHLKLTRIVY